jgi:hypothetical protein
VRFKVSVGFIQQQRWYQNRKSAQSPSAEVGLATDPFLLWAIKRGSPCPSRFILKHFAKDPGSLHKLGPTSRPPTSNVKLLHAEKQHNVTIKLVVLMVLDELHQATESRCFQWQLAVLPLGLVGLDRLLNVLSPLQSILEPLCFVVHSLEWQHRGRILDCCGRFSNRVRPHDKQPSLVAMLLLTRGTA